MARQEFDVSLGGLELRYSRAQYLATQRLLQLVDEHQVSNGGGGHATAATAARQAVGC